MKRKRRPNWLLPIFILLGLGVGAWSARGPWRVYKEQQGRATAMRTELNTLKDSRIRHITEKSKTSNPVHMEEEARKQGYRSPDEVVIKR
jgi:cell division protein FtsB